MPSSHTSSMDNNTGSEGGWSAGRPPHNEKPSRDARLDTFRDDKDYKLAHQVYYGEQRPQTLEAMLGKHLTNLPRPTTNGH
ncbi:hypothetical protein CDEST_03500 [Colletotrichum destructivum]|uniref:Uncharacterized protein n=1 Tax=Colletotrichum destructivum TaxID=34406 RepID=A0AAX4I501_9PEZI|nr:hypothetical protein CDEST_03500 [Colletotrichum destructivum]